MHVTYFSLVLNYLLFSYIFYELYYLLYFFFIVLLLLLTVNKLTQLYINILLYWF